ncbi:MAG: 1-deoxy-D-xylulose-5-phosphate synthase [Clostridia bacterium]|nr:1-deoxy-D-xylulose-5-phosphate synthase [Clostridia bacterium]
MKFPTPKELRSLSPERVKRLCAALRGFLVKSVEKTGGHLASNLGIVETAVAILRVTDEKDRVVYDTGHQCYVHKILTGRGEAFGTLRTLGGISGFPRIRESEYDAFGTGHSGTGISAALGLARAARLKGDTGWSIVVIGDGAFSGGMVYEALNNIEPEDRVIIVLNDNGMSISKSVGRVKSALNEMRTAGYYRFKDSFRRSVEGLPLLGEPLTRLAGGVKRAVKRHALPMGNLFEQLGLHYYGPADGNDEETVELLLREAKKNDRPSIIHLCTKKGYGYAPAMENPGRFHGISPAGEKKKEGKSASCAFGDALCRLGQEDERVLAITAAMGDGVGLDGFAKLFPKRFFDVGIAEEHAMTFGAALAAAGQRPVFAVYSTFYQRAVDQLLHDAALQELPLVLALDRAGISGEDGATHHGLFDLPLTLPIPGVRVTAPVSEGELERHLRHGLAREDGPTVIRYAKGPFDEEVAAAFPGRADVECLSFGDAPRVSVVTFGRVTARVLEACRRAWEAGISTRILRFGVLKGFDREAVAALFSPSDRVLFVEEGILEGGFSQSIAMLIMSRGLTLPTAFLGVEDRFLPHGDTERLLDLAGLSSEHIGKEMERLAKIGSVSG